MCSSTRCTTLCGKPSRFAPAAPAIGADGGAHSMSGFFQTAFYFGYMFMFCFGLAILTGAPPPPPPPPPPPLRNRARD